MKNKIIKFTYDGIQFEIDTKTCAISSKQTQISESMNLALNRMYVTYIDKAGKSHYTTKSRLICQAFHPNRNYKKLQCDHIDGDHTNDNPENLRWLTRKQNNSTELAKKRKSVNAKFIKHENAVLKAVNQKTNEVQYFMTGYQAAAYIGCSHVLIYRVANKSDWVKSAKGWSIEWISFQQCINEFNNK